MSYVKTVWVDGSPPYITAEKLNHLEGGVEEALPKSGGTMSGAIAMGGQPVSGLPAPAAADHATRKSYVDQAVDGVIAGAIPAGVIVMWSGSVASIPGGWLLCDGSGGTPDLRDRFIVGAGGDLAPGATGGAASVALSAAQLPSHSHGSGSLSAGYGGSHTHGAGSLATDSPGSHMHTYQRLVRGNMAAGATDGPYGVNEFVSSPLNTSSNGAHTHSISGSTASGGGHSHSISGSTSATGSGSAHENRPPYYALAYIMKA